MRTEECEVIIGPAVQRVGEIFHNIQNIDREPAKGESWQNSYQMYPIRFQKDLLNKEVFFNPNQTGGGQMAHRVLKALFLGNQRSDWPQTRL